MRLRGYTCVRALAAATLAAVLLAIPAATAGAQGDTPTRYSLAGGCWALKSNSANAFVARANGGFAATAGGVSGGEPFTLQATDLGKYLLYGSPGDFVAAGGDGSVAPAARPSEAADFTVAPNGGGFTLKLDSTGKFLTAGDGGKLAMGDSGDAAIFTFTQTTGCTKYPEVEVNASGDPLKANPFGEVAGIVDAHIHMMAFRFLGGGVHCGQPWHPYGVTEALVDCPDHSAGAAPLETALGGEPAHDPVGWPTFKYWPNPQSLTHEQTYWKWLERAWRGGLRTYVNLMVDNGVLCELYPIKKHGCNEMDTVRLEIADIYKLQDYIDAQYGGPGKGFFRIVTDPFQARQVIADGKLAVILGIETSRLFGCTIKNDVPGCTREQIDQQLDEVHKLGIRDLELVNKFDNALTGVAGDAGTTGVITNTGNFYETGSFFQLQTCTGPEGANDREATTIDGRDALVGSVLQTFLPPGLTPIYPAAPHCNKKGLTDLGEYLVRRMMDKGMLIDPDHMSVRGRDHLLSVLESENYSGVVSSHSWSSEDAYPRIYNLGGFIAPYAGSSTSFVKEWQRRKKMKNPRYYWGFGYGADMNGFGAQGNPRGADAKDPVKYPFKSFDGGVTFDKQKSGERVYDINVDGVAHYGLYPDWIEDLRKLAGDEIVADMARGSEAYLQTWERAVGVPRAACSATRARFYSNGLLGRRLNADWTSLLRAVGQPGLRNGPVWEWCVNGEENGKAKVVTVLKPNGRLGLVVSSARYHRYRNLGAGKSAKRIPKNAKKFGSGVYATKVTRGVRFVYGVKKGKIAFVAVAQSGVAKTPAALRAQLKSAGML